MGLPVPGLDGKLGEHLAGKRGTILDLWRRLIRETYPPDTAAFLDREQDPFANPVGHFIRHGTGILFDELTGAMDRATIQDALDPVVRIRAVQNFDAAQAVAFAFFLKRAVRGALGAAVEREGLAGALLDFEARIDQLALLAFNTYMKCREQLYEIRAKELKNRSAVLLRRMGMADFGAGPPKGNA
ncbi:MAG: RsbRD N-terminal domain-containing protein [Planctomycetota bacterium]|jgi:hypothetical protein